MRKTLDTEEFVKRSKKIHGDFYGYERVTYTKNDVKVEIVCPSHGVFLQCPSTHMVGVGCFKCRVLRTAEAKKTRAKAKFFEFLKECVEGKYDTTKVEYRGRREKVVLVCPTHGEFAIGVNSLYKGCGCEKCAKDARFKPYSYYLDRFKSLHSDLYKYNDTTFVDVETPMEIICEEHGPFWMSPHSHSRGYGCPSCACTGHKNDKPGRLYIVKNEDYLKIGITNRDVGKRMKQIQQNSGKVFETVALFEFEDGGKARRLEKDLLTFFNNIYDKPPETFDGWTESFVGADTPFVIEKALELIEGGGQ